MKFHLAGHNRFIAALMLAGLLAAGGFLIWQTRSQEPEVAPYSQTVHLYFADLREACLWPEKRTLSTGNGQEALGAALVSALMDGPETDLAPTLPPGGAVKAFSIKNNVAFVDLDTATVSGIPGGSESELLAVYSIVNTVCLNLHGVEAVKILVEGQSTATLKGHLDLRFAFKPNETIIRQQREK